VTRFEDPSAPHTDLLVGIDVVRQEGAATATLLVSRPEPPDHHVARLR
jgi:hypothetical protein